ncbi:MAG: hypothetical protein IKM32_07555 [Clostridia bacterium]|nr:hypothetical protein [Clostridia bacterium]
MNGKNRCRILKDIRKRIADENGIEFVTSECKYKGDCLGTCPKCEAEVQYLERELAKKRSLGKRVALAGVAAGVALVASGCESIKSRLGLGTELQGEMPDASYTESSEYCVTMGEEIPESSKVSDIVDGEMVEVVGEMPDISLPEISSPYSDIMGDYEVFDIDINEVAEMDNDAAFEALKNWSRAHIDYAWQEKINFRDTHITEFIVSGVAVIDVYFDEQGAVTKVIISADEELMGDIPS